MFSSEIALQKSVLNFSNIVSSTNIRELHKQICP